MFALVEKSSSDNFDLIILERVWRPNSGMVRSWCRQKFSIAPQHLCLIRGGHRSDAWDGSLAASDLDTERNRRKGKRYQIG
jgi:hypothetical protein